MSIETAKHICREICAYKGEPPCFELDAPAGEEYRPCEECEPVAAWHDAEIAALKHDIERHISAAAEIERLEREMRYEEDSLDGCSDDLRQAEGMRDHWQARAERAEADNARLVKALKGAQERFAQIDCATIGQVHNTSPLELLDWCKAIASRGFDATSAALRAARQASEEKNDG